MKQRARFRKDERRSGGRSILIVALFFLTGWVAWGTDGLADEPTGFQAGAYAADITPTRFPISLNGQMHDRPGGSALDRLHARCLVLDDGKAPVAIVVVDSCLISRAIFDEAKRRIAEITPIRTERMLMSATHTHSAPTVVGVFQSEPDTDYIAFLIDRIVDGVGRAYKNREPAQIGWGVGQDRTQVFCRDWLMKPGTALTNPFGGTTNDQVQMHPGYLNPNAIEPTAPVDPDVSLVAVKAKKDGRPLAVLANYSMHYAGYGVPPNAASADYFGRFAERLKTLVGAEQSNPGFVGILSNGTSGNLHCYDYSKPQNKQLTIDTVADSVARAAFAAYEKIAYHDAVPLVMRESKMTLPLRLPSAEELQRAKDLLASLKKPSLSGFGEIYARETVLLSEFPKVVEFKLQALRIGTLGIAAIPCETFAETGLAIKQKSPLKPTFTIELANGYNGYIPPPARHAIGGYATWRARSSCLEVGAEPKILAEVLRLLDEVANAQE
ncbi:hypothetical protein SAMN05444166_7930 [Singulisphaera sp. GP187]|uniref:hypothetical protein n=1 Tax=Singulisphaera sp. GP187 TaxID=1882752 RepID=UPI0009288890|nr:hypothetical protein [Singulisphaera sp. GP187]SIO66026.1 hypothetical protein SAMN05444166_7930 [Singulisphaera sp. GP187]